MHAGIYAAEGNYLDASLSLAGMVPFAGMAVTGARMVKNTVKTVNKALDVANVASDAFRVADGIPLNAATPPIATLAKLPDVPTVRLIEAPPVLKQIEAPPVLKQIEAPPAVSTRAGTSVPVHDEVPLFIETPYGIAVQADDAASLALRDEVLQGSTVDKGGSSSSVPPSESQFFAVEDPAGAGYAARYGIPEENLPFEWVSEGTIRPGAPFVTRPAPGVGLNLGGAREVVTVPGGFVPGA